MNYFILFPALLFSNLATAPLDDVAHCHCSICRRTTGGIVTTWATVPRAAFRWLAGEPAEYASSASC
ncbi:GFA family protein, partial [Pseudomonas aeruginosa]